MTKPKQYGSPSDYEAKLERVMTRLGVDKFNFNWDRHGSWVEFWYKGQLYRFDHSVDKSKATKEPLRYGSDTFAMVVLTLEDLARMVERGIYDLQVWVEGMKALPAPKELPWFLIALGFDRDPNAEEIKTAYRSLARVAHPDTGGSDERFKRLTNAYNEALKWAEEVAAQ